MKRIVLIVILLTDLVFSQPKWNWQYPLPQANTLQSSWITSTGDIYAVGEASTIIKSIDRGESWNVLNLVGGNSKKLFSISFPSSQKGYAVGEAGKIVRTLDAGASWDTLTSFTSLDLCSINFINQYYGWCGGQSGILFRTTDGGVSWVGQHQIGYPYYILKISFLDTLTGYIIAGYLSNSKVFLKTTDGGNVWNPLTLPVKVDVRGIYFVNNDTGWIVGSNSSILQTTDDAKTWQIQNRDSTNASYFFDVLFANVDTGWVVGTNNSIMSTTNGGRMWRTSLKDLFTLYSISAFNSLNAFAVGENGRMFSTTDGGMSWNCKQSILTIYRLRDIFFCGNSIGWMIDNTGEVYKTTDGGEHWITFSNLQGAVAERCYFVSSNIGWITSWGGIYKTTDGGISWAFQSSNDELHDVFFINDSIGWVVGDYGSISKTTDGGVNWTSLNSGIGNFLYTVYFVNSRIGWAAGASGKIIKTIDGGSTWFSQTSDNSYNLNCLYFIDTLNGWAGGDYTALIHTTDGGITWSSQAYENSYAVNDIKFVDGVGYAVGQGSSGWQTLMIQSTDNGWTWRTINTGTTHMLNALYFTSKNNGWIVGDYGTILHTTDGGITYSTPNISNSTPSHTSLSQNYPNPFNPTTTIEFKLPSSMHVKLTVFDLLGREVIVLINEHLKLGIHKIKWQASAFPSGIYFYRIETKDKVETKKFILIK